MNHTHKYQEMIQMAGQIIARIKLQKRNEKPQLMYLDDKWIKLPEKHWKAE